MSGFGERFRKEGYTVPKPLIEIDGQSIIGHVLDLFPGEKEVWLICNQDHLDNAAFRMREILLEKCPTARIVGIAPHKRGPVHAVQQIAAQLDPERPVMVNYCDFSCLWDWEHFKQSVAENRCAGAIPAYRGFHPHSLGNTNYAYMQEAESWVQAIQEKQPYTDNRMQEYASSGSYYFASARLMQAAMAYTLEHDLQIGGEYYVSLAYRYLLHQGLPVWVYPLQHFMQWGTPEDVAEYRRWSSAFAQLARPVARTEMTTANLIMPMAGMSQRFANEGYKETKPLISVSGEAMVLQATRDMPACTRNTFVLRADMPGHDAIVDALHRRYPGALCATLPTLTEGQALTTLAGLDALEASCTEVQGPLHIAACDHGLLYDSSQLHALLSLEDVDVLVWTVRGHPNAARHPNMYGWIKHDALGRVESVSVKTSLGNPHTDAIVLGCFSFKRASDLRRVVERLVERSGRINGEFYLDSAINDAIAMGLQCRVFEVDHYLSWGTPNDLRTFEYWQSCFHQWPHHPYRLELDNRVPKEARVELEARYCDWQIPPPGPWS